MTPAFVFPGQGSQSVGRLADVASEFSLVGETFAQASAALGYDLWQLVAEGPAEALIQTSVTQPAMLTASIALYRILQAAGKADVAFMAGHSLGEYTALTAAGVFSLADAVRLVRARGEYMQSAVPEGVGAMAAILGLTDDQVRLACEQAAQGEVVAAVKSRTISINAAAAVASLPAEEQVAAAMAGKDELKQAAKRVREAQRKPRAEPVVSAGEPAPDTVAALQQRIAELTAENAALRQQVAELSARQ